jgi:hypothetical protein
MDLVTCRNTLMYFSPHGQARTLAKLYLSMTPRGVLILGDCELATATKLFVPFDADFRAWIKAPDSNECDALTVLQHVGFRGPIRRERQRYRGSACPRGAVLRFA